MNWLEWDIGDKLFFDFDVDQEIECTVKRKHKKFLIAEMDDGTELIINPDTEEFFHTIE